MSQEIINRALQKTLISPLTSDKLWSDFLQANSYEIENMREEYSKIKNNWNINNNDKDNLVRIAESFGYTPNLIINNTISMSKKEIESIPYRIREKTTYNGYSLIFQQNGVLGDTFNYYWNGEKLIKAIDYKKTIENLLNYNHYTPFYGTTPIKNFSTTINSLYVVLDYLFEGEIVYDADNLRYYSLDQKFNPFWKLDTPYMQTPTCHLGVEYFPSNWYCTYYTTLGFAKNEVYEYSTQISLKEYYISESIQIMINNNPLDIIINTDMNKEYISDSKNILNPNSYYDKTKGIVNIVFNIIPINYEISISYKINLFMTSDYFYYLEQGMNYNRRCPIIPHTGIFLVADIAQFRGSDFYYPNEGNYTICDLKLKAQTTSAYNRYISLSEMTRLDNATDEEGNPNGKENYKLDDVIKWHLDTSTQALESINDKIKYIASGNKALPISNEQYSQIFNMNNLIFAYNMNGDNDSSIIIDASKNLINCTIYGNSKKINGIIDKSLNFNGETWAISNSQLSFDNSRNYTLGIWFNANAEPNNSIECIFDSFINISYDYNNEEILINSTPYFCSKNENHFLCLLINSHNTITVNIDGEEIDTFGETLISTSSNIYIGVDSSLNNPFFGLIDNLWFVAKTLTHNEIKYINDNKITVITHMGNRLNYYKLVEDEIYDDDNYLIIQSYVKAMDITNETLNIEDYENSKTFEFQTNTYPILNPYFEINYKDSRNRTIKIKANEKGEFYNEETSEIITGEIDFENGKCVLDKNTIKSKSQQKIVDINDEPYTKVYSVAYNQIINGESHWYENYDSSTDRFSNEIIANKYIKESASDVFKTSSYYDEDDRNVKIYEDNDDEKYYIESNNNKIFINVYTIDEDNENTRLYSSDGYKLYLNLQDLIVGHGELSGGNYLKACIDLGESSGQTLYTIDNGTTMYLNVECSADRQIKKYVGTVNGVETYGYTLGTDLSIYYSNLSFNSTITFDNTPELAQSFNPMYFSIKSTQTKFELTLQETRYKYTNITIVKYISNFVTQPIIAPETEIIKNTLVITFWMNIGEVIKECNATVSAEGGVSGDNILSGNFDYDSNILTVNFIDEVDSDVVVSFEYYYSLDIDITQPLIINYKSEKSTKINEIGLEDENHELIAYMTFPDIEFHSIYNNISAMFAINKIN